MQTKALGAKENRSNTGGKHTLQRKTDWPEATLTQAVVELSYQGKNT